MRNNGSQHRITPKFGIWDKFDTLIPKIVVPRTKNQMVDHVHTPPQSAWKLVAVAKIDQESQKSKSRNKSNKKDGTFRGPPAVQIW